MNDVLHDMLIWFAKFTAISVVLLLTVRQVLRRRRKKPAETDSGNDDSTA
jgi:flagellar biosynthesis/type III secretory pathway M-ring protein FliF/YscJ